MLDDENVPYPPAFIANLVGDYECTQSRYQEATHAVRRFEEVRHLDPSRAYRKWRNGTKRPEHFSDSDFYVKLAEERT
eukprot:6587908-Alexandrium_andersonii.AAC.1